MSIDERKVKWDSEVSIDESKIQWDEPKAIDESKIKWDEPKDQGFIQENLAGYGKAPEDLTTLEKILRGVSSANLRMQEAVNGANDWLGNGIKPTQEELNNQKWLRDTLESDKEKLSQANITPERKQAIEALKQQSANARGFGENAKAVISTLYDTATHPSEWTAQGVTEGIFSPENIASINPISKGATVGARLFSGAGNAALENVLFGTPIDIAQAKGQGKSDEEIKNTAIQSAVGNLLAGATIGGTMTGLKEGYSKLKSKPDTIEEDTQTPTNFDAQSYLDSTKASKASEELGLNDNPNYKTMEEIKAYIAENDKGGQAQADLFEQQMNLWAKAENLRRAEEGKAPVTAEQMANDFILKYEAQPKEVVNENVTTDNLQNHPRFQELMDMRRDVSSKDTQYSQTLVQPRGTDADGNWYGASYDRNFNADFELTKADVKAIESGKATPEQITKLRNDLGRLENDPMYKQAPMDANEQLAANGELFQFVGAKDDEIGAFSDLKTKKIMREIDDSSAKIKNVVDPIIEQKQIEIKSKIEELKKQRDEIYSNNKALTDEQKYRVETNFKNRMQALELQLPRNIGTDVSTRHYKDYGSKLSNILEHEQLYKKYPKLKDTHVEFDDNLEGTNAFYDPERNVIGISRNLWKLSEEDQVKTISHEIQHKIQEIENMPKGGSPEEFIRAQKKAKDALMYEEENFLEWREAEQWAKYKKGDLKFEDTIQGFLEEMTEKEYVEKMTKLEKEKPFYAMDLEYINKHLDDAHQRYNKAYDSLDRESPLQKYFRLYGEQQARATEYRKDMTPEQRTKESWQQTLERVEGKYEEPIIRYDELYQGKNQAKDGEVKGSYTIDEKLIKLFESHDVSTLNHELGHRFLFTLSAKELGIAEKVFGVKDGKWEVKHHEAFADAYARYIAEGKAPSAGIKAIFEKFTAFMKEILLKLKENNGGKMPPLSKEAKEFFAAVLGNDKARNELMKKYTAKDASSMGEGELFSKAYHGTPHEVDKFDTEKIGTGEGAQAYGYGLYFADSKEVAEFYRTSTMSRDNRIAYDKAVEEIKNLKSLIEEAQSNPKLTSQLPKLKEFLVKAEKTKQELLQSGNLYRVDLKPKEEEYLLWDKPLDEQSLHVKEALQKELDMYRKSEGAKGAYVNNSSGEKLYKEFIYTYGSDKKASERLNELGIKGIKYEDGNSRSRDVNKNHNYVIFKNEDVEITGANGKMFDGTPNELFQKIEYTKENEDFKIRASEKIDDIVKVTKSYAYGKRYAPEKVYRGVSGDGILNNEHGASSEGIGLYTTANKSLAKDYGRVMELDKSNIPSNPLVFRDLNNFEIWHQQIMYNVLGYKRASDFGNITINEIVDVIDKSIDGLQIGEGKKAFWVKYPDINSLIESSPNELFQTSKERQDLSVGDETLMESVQRKVQDKFLRVKKLIEAKANINAIADKLNPYLAEELYHGRVQNRLDQFQKDYVEPIIKKISSSKVTIDQVDEYLHARHAIERNRKMEELNGIKDGSGMSDAEAVRILARYANNTDMLDIAKMVYAMNKDRLKLIYKEGLESADFIKTIDGTYNNYVPLKRVMDSDGNYMSTGKGFDIKGKELKRAKGSNREVESPLLNSILAFNETIIRAEKNEVGKAMINFAEAYPDANLYEVNSLKHVPQYDSNGDVISMNPKYQLANNVLHVKIDGKVKEIVFKDPLLARAFKNLSSEQMGAVMQGAQKLIRYYASINTQYNPDFVISNFERDLQTAMINLPEEVKGSRAIILRDVFSAMNGIHKSIYERTPNEWSKLYAEMKAEGGTTGWIEQYNVPDMKKSTEILIKKYEGEVMPKEAFKAVLDHIDNINTVIENASRLVVYKMAKESGLSNKRSASIAKNLTVNFNRKGEMGQVLNLMYMFFNASIQGTTRTIQAIRHSKVVQGIVGGIIASSTALTLYNMSQNEEAYSLIPQYEKDTNLIFMNEDGTYKKVKVPYGYNVFKSLGDIMAEAYNGDLKPEKMPSRILGVAVNAFSPIGTAPTLGQMLTPTIARPAVDLAVNKNFAGNPIQPEKSGFGASSPDSYNYFNSVNPIAKSIAQEANKLTGGNMYKSGMADVSPETIEYLFETATGGVGKFFNRVYKTASGNAETNDIPFMRNFIGEATDKSKQSKVYDIYKRSGEEIIDQKELDRFVKFGREGVSNGSIEPDRFKSMVTTIASNQAKLKWADRNNIQSKDDVLNSPSIMMDALQSGVPKSEILSIAKKKKKEDEALLKR